MDGWVLSVKEGRKILSSPWKARQCHPAWRHFVPESLQDGLFRSGISGSRYSGIFMKVLYLSPKLEQRKIDSPNRFSPTRPTWNIDTLNHFLGMTKGESINIPLSYLMMGLLPQMHRDEAVIQETIVYLIQHKFNVVYPLINVPKIYLGKWV